MHYIEHKIHCSVRCESRFSDPQPRFVRDQGSRTDGEVVSARKLSACCTLADRFEVLIVKLGARFN